MRSAWVAASPGSDHTAPSSSSISINNGDVAGLISAIQTLNSSGGGTIELAAGGSYPVSAPSDWWYGPNAFPAIRSAIVIHGNRATISRVSGSPKFRFFYVSGGFSTLPAGNFTLQNLSLTGGLAQGGRGGNGDTTGGGGGGMGGAVFNQGTISLTDVQLIQNTAQGGAGGLHTCNYGGGGGGGMGGNGGDGCNNDLNGNNCYYVGGGGGFVL